MTAQTKPSWLGFVVAGAIIIVFCTLFVAAIFGMQKVNQGWERELTGPWLEPEYETTVVQVERIGKTSEGFILIEATNGETYYERSFRRNELTNTSKFATTALAKAGDTLKVYLAVRDRGVEVRQIIHSVRSK